MNTPTIDHIAFDNMDRLINVEMRSGTLPRGLKWTMYKIARSVSPLPLVAAVALALNGPPGRVLIASGAAVPGDRKSVV